MRMCLPNSKCVALALLALGQVFAQPQGRPLALPHVTVIDATGSAAQPDMTVLIEHGQIARLGKSTEFALPREAEVVEATGKFLIPGLVDMHVHTTWDRHYIRPLMLANGVTGVREMFAQDLPAIQRRRGEVAGGSLAGPRILAAGPIVDGLDAPWPHSIIATNAAEGRAAVARVKSEGYDYVKVYSALNREAYFAIAEEAKREGIPYAGHVPGSVSAIEASNAGQRSFEHLYGISRGCSTREAELQKASLSYLAASEAELDSFSEEKAAALLELLRRNGTWQVPTLVVDRNAALYSDPEYSRTFAHPSRLRYVPYALHAMWKLGLRLTPALPRDQLEVSRRYFEWQLRMVGAMQRAGVGILTGTDTPNPYVHPGFSLHDELELLVQAGLTPMQALQAATRNPALYFGTLKATGTIESGKVADLVLLDANPLEDIRNTRRLRAVIFGGKLIAKPGLEALLEGAGNHRLRANPAAFTLIGLLLHMMRKVLYIALAVLLGVLLTVYWVRRRRHATA